MKNKVNFFVLRLKCKLTENLSGSVTRVYRDHQFSDQFSQPNISRHNIMHKGSWKNKNKMQASNFKAEISIIE
jgi:hypothetical protein